MFWEPCFLCSAFSSAKNEKGPRRIGRGQEERDRALRLIETRRRRAVALHHTRGVPSTLCSRPGGAGLRLRKVVGQMMDEVRNNPRSSDEVYCDVDTSRVVLIHNAEKYKQPSNEHKDILVGFYRGTVLLAGAVDLGGGAIRFGGHGDLQTQRSALDELPTPADRLRQAVEDRHRLLPRNACICKVVRLITPLIGSGEI